MRKDSRTDGGEKKNRMDAESFEFYNRVRDFYLKIAAKEKKRFRILDANGSISEVHKEVLATVTEFLGRVLSAKC